MKIGIDGRAAKLYRGTGIGTYTYQLINNLISIDKENDYLLFLPELLNFDSKIPSNFSINKIQESNLAFWEEVRVPNLLKDQSVDLYHVPQNGVGLPLKKSSSFVITLHDIIPLKMPETVSDRYLKIFNEDMPKILDKCEGVITVSEFSKNDIVEGFSFPKEKIFVTHLAPEKIYMPYNKVDSRTYLKNKYSIDSSFILYVGGFSPRKNILGLLEAFSLLKNKYKKDIKLVVAGKHGISYDLYKNRAIELNISNDVIFPGFITLKDMPYFYSSCKMFIYPSFYEGFGLPPLEAMACGAPVIASNVTSIPEILDNSCLLINPNDPKDIYGSMLSILEDKKLEYDLIEKGLARSNSFSWRKCALETLNAYKTILSTK